MKDASQWANDEERYDFLSAWACQVLNDNYLIVIEGYSMGSKGQVFNIGENTGLLKYKLYKYQKKFSVAAPTTIKKFATGSGRADKDAMYDAFVAETNYDMKGNFGVKTTKSPVSDIVDSYYLAKYSFHLCTPQTKS